ncbi:MAG: flagellar export protein FliJ [Burkholderiales bacterium]|nr:flagellar export protein FliJ [Burkholderiales bacterium]
MADTFRLAPVLELAQRRLETATGELQKLALLRNEAQSRLEQLQRFLSDYRDQFRQGLENGLESDRMRDFQAFLSKLERAVEMQHIEVQRCQSAWEAKHRTWMDLRRDEQAMSVLKARHLAAEAVRDGKREQKQQDEFAGRHHRFE